jgi:signal transduction histidine kinase
MSRRVFLRVLHPTVACAAVHALLPAAMAAAQPSPVRDVGTVENVRTVLTIHWSTEEFPSTPVVDAAIRETLLAPAGMPIDYFTEFLETDRFPPEEAAESLRDYIQRKYRGRRIDAVIAVAEPALEFAVRYRELLFPDAPIVASVVRVPGADARAAGPGITGVTQTTAYDRTLQLALKLQPSAERIFVIAQAPTIDYAGLNTELATAAGGLPLTLIAETRLPRLLEAVRGIPARSVVLYIRYSREDPGQVIFPTDAAQMVSEASPAPVYGVTDAVIGTGVVGGVVTSRDRIGRRLAEMVRMILAGTRAQDIPIEALALVPTFDWRQIERFGIDAALLPAESIVRFRTPTAWDLYRWYIVGAASVVVVQALLIAGLLVQRGKRRKAELALRVTSDRNRELADSLLTAQEAERTRIARELHDDVGQRVASLSIALSAVKRKLQGDDALRRDVAQLQEQAVSLSSDLRQLSHDLHPAALEHLGLLDALRSRCDELEESSGVRVRLEVPDDWVEVPDAVSLCFYRVAQEALRNVAQHAAAQSVTVRLGRQNGRVVLSVADDGKGLPNGTIGRHAGLGLRSLTERVRMLGGTLDMESKPGTGTTLAVSLPIGGAHAS